MDDSKQPPDEGHVVSTGTEDLRKVIIEDKDLNVNPAGGIAVDPNFFIPFEGERPHQIHPEGGDSSSDWFCYP